MAERDATPTLYFDGVCNLCNGAVNFIIDRDPDGAFRFASLQSDHARRALPAYGLDPERLDTVALVVDGRAYVKSTAALKTLARLRSPWRALAIFLVVPTRLRDLAYDVVARSRYRWFGKADQCRVPTPALRARFVDATEDG